MGVRPVTDWRPYWFFPWVECCRVGWFLNSAPEVLVDINAFWTRRRWRKP